MEQRYSLPLFFRRGYEQDLGLLNPAPLCSHDLDRLHCAVCTGWGDQSWTAFLQGFVSSKNGTIGLALDQELYKLMGGGQVVGVSVIMDHTCRQLVIQKLGKASTTRFARTWESTRTCLVFKIKKLLDNSWDLMPQPRGRSK